MNKRLYNPTWNTSYCKTFANSKAVSIMVNPNRKKAFWSNGSNYAGYREYTIDKLLEALEIILFNTYIQFNGCICKQKLEIPMGGNPPPFRPIADLYLSWCEYCYMTKIVKTDYAMAKLLSYNCRYLDNICTIYIYIYIVQILSMKSLCHALLNIPREIYQLHNLGLCSYWC